MRHTYETGDRVYYVQIKYGTDMVAFSDMTKVVDENDPGLITRVIDDDCVMVLWLNDNEVSEHDVSVLTPARKKEST